MVSHRDYATLLALASPGRTTQIGSFFVACGRYDTQHNDFQHNDAQDNSDENATLSIMAGHCYAVVMLNVVVPSCGQGD